MFDDVLVHLIQRIESKALSELSSTLAPIDNAPIEVVRLSRHDEITVAGPILSQSNRLPESDLLDIASTKGQGTSVGNIGTRPQLSEGLTSTR